MDKKQKEDKKLKLLQGFVDQFGFNNVKSHLAELDEKKEILDNLGRNIYHFFDKRDLARQMLQFQPIYFDSGKNWWLWNKEEFKWKVVDETEILRAVDYQSRTNTISSKDKSEIIEALKQEARGYNPEPLKSTWIQFKDKIIDIETDEVFDAQPKYFATNPLPWKLGEECATPMMDKIFTEWVGEKYVQTLYEILSYCLIPDYPIHRLFCFYGAGLNGKSCFLNLLRQFIGEDNCCSTELDTLLGSRFEITKLHKKLVCQMGETNFGEMSKTSILKKLTGGDLIGFEYKNKTPFEDTNYAKVLLSTNNLPTTNDKTIGFYRRWLIIDFPNQFTEKKNILADIPEEEYNNLAKKSVMILKYLLIKREFSHEGTIKERTEKFESKSDFLEYFLDQFTEESYDNYISSADFKKKFSEWCKENRHREMSDVVLGKMMKSKGKMQDRVYMDWLYDGKGGQLRVWTGIKWRD